MINKERKMHMQKETPIAEVKGIAAEAVRHINTAYRRGLKAGEKDKRQEVRAAYYDGLEDAWSAARCIFEMPIEDYERLFGEGDDWPTCRPLEAIAKIKKLQKAQETGKKAGTDPDGPEATPDEKKCPKNGTQ